MPSGTLAVGAPPLVAQPPDRPASRKARPVVAEAEAAEVAAGRAEARAADRAEATPAVQVTAVALAALTTAARVASNALPAAFHALFRPLARPALSRAAAAEVVEQSKGAGYRNFLA